MNKQEYLSAIRVRIPKMPTEDMERFIAYYSEMIDDRMEDGMTEEEAVAMMDTPDDAVDQILEDTPLSKIVKQKIKPTHRLRAWEIVLIVLGSPVWVPLLLTAGILVLSMLVVAFSRSISPEEDVAIMESGTFIFFIYRSPLDADTFTVSAFTS